MNREHLVEIINLINNKKNITKKIFVEVIEEYCKDNGKETKDIDKFVQASFRNVMGVQHFETALDYLKGKYEIIELWNGSEDSQNRQFIKVY